MKDKDKTKEQLLDEIAKLRQKNAELEASEFERRRIEEELRQSEERYRAIFEALQDVYYRTDKEGRITLISPSVYSQAGYNPKEVIGHPVTDFYLHPSDRVVFMQRLKETGVINDYELILKAKDGRVIDVSASSKIVVGKDGKPVGVEGVLRDITKRKQAEAALKMSEEKYRTLTDNINVGIYRSTPGPKGRFIEANPALIKMFGYKNREEFFTLTVANLYQNLEDRKKFNDKMLKAEFVRNEELQLKKKDQTHLTGSVSAVAVKDKRGEVKYFDGIVEDITERKWAEQELRESQERYKSLTEASPVGIFHSDPQGDFLYVNERWVEIAKLSPEEAYGKGWEKALHPDDKKRILTEWYQRCQEKRPFKSEFRFQPSKGISVWVLCQSSVEKNVNGEVIGYIGTITDITYRRQVEEALKQRTHDLGERIKELSCLYGIEEIAGGKDVTIEEVLKETVQFIAPSWQYPEITGCRITFEGKKYETSNFKKTKWTQSADIIIGKKKEGLVEVCYLEEKPEIDVGPFLKEERDLINAISERLGQFIERKKAEEALHESEEKYRTLVESATDYIYTIDKDNKVLSLNKAGASLFRKQPEKITGKSIFELFPKEIATGYSDSLKKVFETNRSGSYESKMVAEGKESWLSVSLSPVCDHNGKVVSVMGVSRDITEHKHAQEKIKKSLEEKEVFLKEIHHRVKNNMQIISSLLRIQAADIKDEKIQDMFNGIHHRIRSMAVLYEMLYQSKDMAMVDLSEYIRRLTTHLVSMYRAGLGPLSLKLDVKDVHLDVKRAIPCGLIITELVSNTLKHAFPDGRKGEIAVQMHPNKGKKYILVVKDDGVGIPEGLDFHQTKSLGMKLVLDLVKQINGTFELSKAEGTEFKIVF